VSHRSVLRSVSFHAVCAALPFLFACAESSAQEEPAPVHELEPTSQTVFGARLLLFLEHPHLVRGESARFLAHLSVRASGEPVRAGSVTLEIGAARLTVASPKRDGIFVPEGSLAEAGSHPARLVVTSGELSETLELAPMVVHASPREANLAAAEAEELAGAVRFLMEQQWRVKLLLAEAAPRTLVERLVVPARVVTAEGAEAVVATSTAGRLVAPPGGRLPRTGESVEAGQLLARVEPPLGASERAQLEALQLELELRALEVVREASAAEAELRFAASECERLGKLRAQGLATQQQSEQAERDRSQAQAAVEAARATRAALDALLARRGTGAGSPLQLSLTAPLAGVVVDALRVEGESLGSAGELCRIVDPSRLWIEGRVSEFDLARLGAAPPARATFTALPGLALELAAPLYVAPEIDADTRTLLVRYALEPQGGALRAGLMGELALVTARSESALAIPREALLREQGIPTVYVMLAGELFQRRELELGLEDGAFVEVKAGLATGERVATRGAHVVKLAALSPASFGAGHAH
jgi:membrane fusion protein, heavy metal efflux system